MIDWFTRLQEEYGTLLARIGLLDAYIAKGPTSQVTDEHWSLLAQQLTAMNSYARVLSKRIELEIKRREDKKATPDHRD